MAGERVLVVEDNLMNMELAMALLEEAGCAALEAGTAELGIEMAKSERPALILMDVSLPGMDGLTAVKILKADAETRGIPIIVMTAHAMSGDEAKAMDAGCDGYLTKPINTRQFIQVVSEFLAAAKAEAPASTAVAEASDSVAASIWIMDGEDAGREFLSGLLMSLGYKVEAMRSGADALARVQKAGPAGLPDTVIIGVTAAGTDGFQVTRALRQEPATGELPILIAIASGSQEDRLRAVEAGASDLIAKPLDRIEVQMRVASLVKLKQAQDIIKQFRAMQG